MYRGLAYTVIRDALTAGIFKRRNRTYCHYHASDRLLREVLMSEMKQESQIDVVTNTVVDNSLSYELVSVQSLHSNIKSPA